MPRRSDVRSRSPRCSSRRVSRPARSAAAPGSPSERQNSESVPTGRSSLPISGTNAPPRIRSASIALAIAPVAVAHGDRPRERPGDAGCRRSRRLLGGHAARDYGWCAVLALDDHHRRVDAVDLHRGVEDAIHQLLEVDRAAELPEQPVPAALLLGPLERLREVLPASSSILLRISSTARTSSSFGGALEAGARRRMTTPTTTAATTRAAAIIRIAVARFPGTSSETTSPCTHANGGCNLERGTPSENVLRNWTPTRLAFRSTRRWWAPVRHGDDDGPAIPPASLARVRAPRDRGPASGPSSSPSSVIPGAQTEAGLVVRRLEGRLQRVDERLGSSIPDPAGRARTCSARGGARDPVPRLRSSLPATCDSGRRPPPLGRVPPTLRRGRPPRARRPRASGRSPRRPPARARASRACRGGGRPSPQGARGRNRSTTCCGRSTPLRWTRSSTSSSVDTVAPELPNVRSMRVSNSADVSVRQALDEADRDRRHVGPKRLPGRLAEAPREHGRTGLRRAGEEDRELALAASTRDVAPPRHPRQEPCQLGQRGAARGLVLVPSLPSTSTTTTESGRPLRFGPGDLTAELELVAAPVADAGRRVDVHPRLDLGESPRVGQRDAGVAEKLPQRRGVLRPEGVGRKARTATRCRRDPGRRRQGRDERRVGSRTSSGSPDGL